jgi:precorrin-6Y C5,15-methyltransferase (decarboxylating)
MQGGSIDHLKAEDGPKEKPKEVLVTYDKDEIEQYIKDKDPDSVALLYSGDIGFYSGAAGIVDRLDRYEIVTIPGISSGVYLCDKLMIPWQDVRFLSCHGRDLDLTKETGIANTGMEAKDRDMNLPRKFVVLLGREDDAARICREVCDNGYEDARVYIGEELGYKDEKIRSGRAGDFTKVRTSALSVILVDLTGSSRNDRTMMTEQGFTE